MECVFSLLLLLLLLLNCWLAIFLSRSISFDILHRLVWPSVLFFVSLFL